MRAVAERLRADVMSAQSVRTLSDARSTCELLSPFEDAEALIAAIRDRRKAHEQERDRLTRAVIDLHREGPSRFWSSVMVVAYYPLLRRIRSKLAGGQLTSDDLDQLVIIGFLTTLSTAKLELYRHISIGLDQRTRRYVYNALGREFVHETNIDVFARVEPRSNARRGNNEEEGSVVEIVSLSRFLSRASKDGLSDSVLTVISATQDESLREYCERQGGSERVYQRMKKQRTRAMRRLRVMAKSEDGGG